MSTMLRLQVATDFQLKSYQQLHLQKHQKHLVLNLTKIANLFNGE